MVTPAVASRPSQIPILRSRPMLPTPPTSTEGGEDQEEQDPVVERLEGVDASRVRDVRESEPREQQHHDDQREAADPSDRVAGGSGALVHRLSSGSGVAV